MCTYVLFERPCRYIIIYIYIHECVCVARASPKSLSDGFSTHTVAIYIYYYRNFVRLHYIVFALITIIVLL